MPYVLDVRGQTVVLEDAEARQVLDRLVRATRRDVWARLGGPDSQFTHYYRVWEHHQQAHDRFDVFVMLMEGLGGARLPAANWARRLRRQQNQLVTKLRGPTLGGFYRLLPPFARAQARFVTEMKTYMSAMQSGGTSAVVGLRITRDASFLVLAACATVLTAGAASAAVTTTARAAMAAGARGLAADAARSFAITQLEHCATGIGRMLSGERISASVMGQDLIDTALSSMGNAALGRVVQGFIRPLSSYIGQMVARELVRGSLGRQLVQELTQSQIEGAVGEALRRFVSGSPGDVRQALSAARNARNRDGIARSMSTSLMGNRNFRRAIEAALPRA